MEKPKEIIKAVYLLWIMLAIGIIFDVIDIFITQLDMVFFSALGLSYIINISIILLINKGSNKARIIFVILMFLGIIMTFIVTTIKLSKFEYYFSICTMLVNAYIIYLLFNKQSSKWFKKTLN